MKTCPACAETILAAAKKCRYCGERLADPSPGTMSSAATPTGPKEQTLVPLKSWRAAGAFWATSLLGTIFMDVGLYRAHVHGNADSKTQLAHIFILSPLLSLFTSVPPALVFRSFYPRTVRTTGPRQAFLFTFGGIYVLLWCAFWAVLMNAFYGFHVGNLMSLVAVGAVTCAAALALGVRTTPSIGPMQVQGEAIRSPASQLDSDSNPGI